MNSYTAVETARIYFDGWQNRHGTPKVIQTDNGPLFTAKLTNEMFRLCQTVHVTSTAYHPQSQGLVERSNRSLLNVLRVLCSRRQNDWHKFTQSVAFAYNTSIHATTKVTPNLAMTGSEKTTPMEFMFPDYNNPLRRSPHDYIKLLQNNLHQVHELVRRNTEQAQVRQRRTHDKRVKATQYKVGDYVTVFVNVAPATGMHKLTPKWTGPYQITKVHDDGATYTINDTTRVHYDRIKYYNGRPSDWHVDADSSTIHITPDVGTQPPTQTVDHDVAQPPFVEENASHASEDTHLSEPDRPSQLELRSDTKAKQTPLPDFQEDYQEAEDRTQQYNLGSETSSLDNGEDFNHQTAC